MTATPAGDAAHVPPPGSPERAAILDAARVPVARELGRPVRFVVKRLQVLDGWAFLHASMLGAGGQPVDYRGTRYQEAAARGHKSDRYAALLRQRQGAWQVLAYSVGPTDMAWADWNTRYAAPVALFPGLDGE
ncbi:hypothetical protein ASG87_13505 [Frateuria sp. Soil773]|nr:hypothetical protein ASG87_13505 [Frateuria sp. Soil773]